MGKRKSWRFADRGRGSDGGRRSRPENLTVAEVLQFTGAVNSGSCNCQIPAASFLAETIPERTPPEAAAAAAAAAAVAVAALTLLFLFTFTPATSDLAGSLPDRSALLYFHLTKGVVGPLRLPPAAPPSTATPLPSLLPANAGFRRRRRTTGLPLRAAAADAPETLEGDGRAEGLLAPPDLVITAPPHL